MFNAGDGHPLLPALVAPWFSVTATLLEVFAVDDVPGQSVPKAVAVTLSVLGTVCVSALSWWEFNFLSRAYQVTLRDAAPPTRTDPMTGRLQWARTG